MWPLLDHVVATRTSWRVAPMSRGANSDGPPSHADGADGRAGRTERTTDGGDGVLLDRTGNAARCGWRRTDSLLGDDPTSARQHRGSARAENRRQNGAQARLQNGPEAGEQRSPKTGLTSTGGKESRRIVHAGSLHDGYRIKLGTGADVVGIGLLIVLGRGKVDFEEASERTKTGSHIITLGASGSVLKHKRVRGKRAVR